MRFLVLVVLLFAATAMAQLSLVPLPCNNSAVLTCPLAYGQTELVCPNAAGGCTPSSCCPALNFADTTVPPEVDAFVVDADNNPFAPLGITLSGAGTVLYDGGNRVLSLAAGQALTLIAPTNYPLCLLEVTTRALGNTTLRLLGPNKNVAIEALGPQAMYTTTDVQVCNAPELTLLNRGRLEVRPGQTLQVLGAPNIAGDATGSGLLVNNGTVQLPATSVLTNFALANNNAASLGSVLDLTLGNAATLTHSRNWTSELYRLNLTLNNLTITTNARVSADSCGLTMGYGAGAPALYSQGAPITNASYGGVGWGNTNALYGNPYTPTNLGSGGTGYWNLSFLNDPYAYPCGGGAIQLKVRNTLTVNGTISAGPNYAGYFAGAGSGGSIWLDTSTLAGSGVIKANGGPDGDYSSNGSGGGRVAIYATHTLLANYPATTGLFTNRYDVSANIQATAGYSNTVNGAWHGSIYLYKRPLGTLVCF